MPWTCRFLINERQRTWPTCVIRHRVNDQTPCMFPHEQFKDKFPFHKNCMIQAKISVLPGQFPVSKIIFWNLTWTSGYLFLLNHFLIYFQLNLSSNIDGNLWELLFQFGLALLSMFNILFSVLQVSLHIKAAACMPVIFSPSTVYHASFTYRKIRWLELFVVGSQRARKVH